MKCHACGTILPDYAKFCAKCGEKQHSAAMAGLPPGEPSGQPMRAEPAPIELSGGPRPEPAPIELSGGQPAGADQPASYGQPAMDFGEPFADVAEPAVPDEAAETVFDAPRPDWGTGVQAEAEPGAGYSEGPQDQGGGYGVAEDVPPVQDAAYRAAAPVEPQEPEPDKAEIEVMLVGGNYEKFRPAFDKFRSRNGFAATWCWPAFLFGMWWYLYRRMYAWITIDIAMFAVVIPVLAYLFIPMLSLAILWPVARGILAKYSYYKRIQGRAETARHDYKTESLKRDYPAGFRGYLATVGGPLNVAYVLIPAAALLVFGVFFGGIIAAIAIPNFLKYQAKAKQAEVKAGLKALYAAEEGYRARHGRYSADFGELNLDLSGQRGGYCYYLSDGVGLPGGCDNYVVVDGVEAWVTDDFFVAVAVGNVDSDPDPDVWAIDETGTIYSIQDDV